MICRFDLQQVQRVHFYNSQDQKLKRIKDIDEQLKDLGRESDALRKELEAMAAGAKDNEMMVGEYEKALMKMVIFSLH